MTKSEIYQKVNDQVIKGLTEKGLQWFKPWRNAYGEVELPYNYAKKNKYSGVNVFILSSIMELNGWEHNAWMTFKQASEMGGKIIKGSKATDVVFWSPYLFDKVAEKPIYKYTAEMVANKERYEMRFLLKLSKVFNLAQIEGIEIEAKEPVDMTDFEPIAEAEGITLRYLTAQEIELKHMENRAYYNRLKDMINMPKPETFIDADSYYKTLFHEMAHSTGHEKRLNRKTLNEVERWGDNTYAREELVAEVSAMYLVGLLNLNPKDNMTNSQAYINGWIKYLKDKPMEAATAMTQATKAVDLITA